MEAVLRKTFKRGQQNFDQLLKDEKRTLHVAGQVEQLKRGRSNNLLSERNALILYRYYYYSKIHELRYEKVLEKLVCEFFLSDRTIQNLTQECYEQLSIIFKQKPQLKVLQKKFDFFTWKDVL